MGTHQRFSTYLNQLTEISKHPHKPIVEGRLVRMVGMTLEAIGLDPTIGQRCEIIHQGMSAEAEVIGFDGKKTFLMPIEHINGLKAGARVKPIPTNHMIPVGPQMLGRVIDATGKPLDSKGILHCSDLISLEGEAINPLDRHPIEETLDVGIRCINSLLTVGRGQRMGLFAGSGVGKSVLLGMMTRFTEADIVVVGLIGERGREVKEFIVDILGEEGLKRAVVVASPADDTPLKRLRAAKYCTAIAEYFRDEGKNVLLLMDSLTRYAQAQREIALSVGEPPATKGYPPSVFSKIPQLVERAGNGKSGGGSITAFYTVLTEGDDLQDPVADSARAILDGHIVLSRKIAEEGCYPAIDIESSISRAMTSIIPPERLQQVLNFKQLYSKYNDNKDFVQIGAYHTGTDPKLDIAIQLYPTMLEFIKQGIRECQDMRDSIEAIGMMQQMFNVLENQAQAGKQQVQAGKPANMNR